MESFLEAQVKIEIDIAEDPWLASQGNEGSEAWSTLLLEPATTAATRHSPVQQLQVKTEPGVKVEPTVQVEPRTSPDLRQHNLQSVLCSDGEVDSDIRILNSTPPFTQLSGGWNGVECVESGGVKQVWLDHVKVEPCIQLEHWTSPYVLVSHAIHCADDERVNSLMLTPPSAQLRGGWCEHERVKVVESEINQFNSTALFTQMSGGGSGAKQDKLDDGLEVETAIKSESEDSDTEDEMTQCDFGVQVEPSDFGDQMESAATYSSSYYGFHAGPSADEAYDQISFIKSESQQSEVSGRLEPIGTHAPSRENNALLCDNSNIDCGGQDDTTVSPLQPLAQLSGGQYGAKRINSLNPTQPSTQLGEVSACKVKSKPQQWESNTQADCETSTGTGAPQELVTEGHVQTSDINPFSSTPPYAQVSGGWCGAKRVKLNFHQCENEYGPSQESRIERHSPVNAHPGSPVCAPDGAGHIPGMSFSVDPGPRIVSAGQPQSGEGVTGSTGSESCNSPQNSVPWHTVSQSQQSAQSSSELTNLKTDMVAETSIKPHQCTQCSSSFTQAVILRKHMLIHTVGKHQCTQCDAKFHWARDLKRHMMRHTGVKPYKCEVCESRFTRSNFLKKHMLTHTGTKLQSGIEQETSQVYSVERHVLASGAPSECAEIDTGSTCSESNNSSENGVPRHADSGLQQSAQSSSTLVKSDDLKTLMVPEASAKPHQCTLCNSSFTQAVSLREHMLIHTVGKHQCTQCDAKFNWARDLRRHVVRHTGIKPYKCQICESRFTRSTRLKKHMLTHTGSKLQYGIERGTSQVSRVERHVPASGTPPQCAEINPGSTCTETNESSENSVPWHADSRSQQSAQSSSTLTKSDDLKTLMVPEAFAKPHQCTLCNSSFTQAVNLRKHMLIHTVGKHQCTQCDAKFNWARDLRRHVMRHTGIKPYKCQICESRFTRSTHLKKHMLTHTGSKTLIVPEAFAKPRQCTLCDSSFTQAVNLRKHMLVHTVGKHQCTQCYAKFKWAGDLKRHMMGHTGDEPYQCQHCESRFTTSNYLRRHMLTHTGTKPHCCSQCDARFANVKNLRKHLLTHQKVLHQCTECGSKFEGSKDLRQHMLTHPSHKPYKCTQCDARFILACRLKQHQLSHTAGKKVHRCSQCRATFARAQYLRMHMLIHTGQKLFLCWHCGSRFTRASGLRKHLNTHTGTRPYQCTQCDSRFSYPEVLKMHMKIHTVQRKLHQCTQCDAKFKWARDLRRHMMRHTGDKPYQCQRCESRFTRSNYLKRHMLTHTGLQIKPHHCTQCDTRFANKKDLKRHLLRHAVKRLHRCTECGAEFSVTRDFVRHMVTHTGQKPHKCAYCKSSFLRACDLRAHERIHTGTTPHQCSECSKKFSYAKDLQKHMITHTSTKPFQCDQCGSSFAREKSLKAHQLLHTGTSPHRCTQCGAAFTTAGNLRMHLQIHNGYVRAFECTECGFAFRQSWDLKRHMQTHKDERPHQCTKCNSRFKRASHLTRHMLTHTGTKPHQCKVCTATFAQTSYLKKHLLTHSSGPGTCRAHEDP